MARTYRRDSRGRFAGGGGGGGSGRGATRMGSIAGVTRSTSTGRRARLSAGTAKAEAAGAKQRSRRDMADSNRRVLGVRYASAPDASLRTVSRERRRESNQGRQLVKAIGRERRSLLRRGSRRGGQG